MDPPLNMKCDIWDETVPLTYGCKVYVLFPSQYMEFVHCITELFSQFLFVRFNANQELCNCQRPFSDFSFCTECVLIRWF